MQVRQLCQAETCEDPVKLYWNHATWYVEGCAYQFVRVRVRVAVSVCMRVCFCWYIGHDVLVFVAVNYLFSHF